MVSGCEPVAKRGQNPRRLQVCGELLEVLIKLDDNDEVRASGVYLPYIGSAPIVSTL